MPGREHLPPLLRVFSFGPRNGTGRCLGRGPWILPVIPIPEYFRAIPGDSRPGRLAALPRSNSCQVADPESCWATSLRRASLTSSHAPNFLYWNLHQQCDEALLLGGMGVETCAHPTYRPITSHKWQHKALLPQSFPHGTKLGLSCWQERYSGVKGSGSASSIALFCVTSRK